ncbi:MAG TPA: intradiol ring-cleavage dioxygenase [Burkholderiales bacterium]
MIARRAFVAAALALPLAGRARQKCADLTPADIEGPFYKAGAPQRASLVESSSRSEKLLLSGTVRGPDCRPLADVTLDFWHADADGNYDNAGYRYRGVVRTDAQGRYALETNLPPPYSGRPRHIHVKLRRPGGKVLTTQLYFPDEARGVDGALVVKMARSPAGLQARFDFVLF